MSSTTTQLSWDLYASSNICGKYGNGSQTHLQMRKRERMKDKAAVGDAYFLDGLALGNLGVSYHLVWRADLDEGELGVLGDLGCQGCLPTVGGSWWWWGQCFLSV